MAGVSVGALALLAVFSDSAHIYLAPPLITCVTKYNWNDQVKQAEVGRACSTNGAKGNACRILVGKPQGRRPLGRPKRKWLDDRWILDRMGCYGLD
jgi:hypothetical protein